MVYHHVPVMLREAIDYLQPKDGEVIVDCTLGGGGYALEIAKRAGDRGKIIAIDADQMAIQNSEIRIQKLGIKNIILEHDNFQNLQEIIKRNGLDKINGIVFDLGLSSAQLEDRSRGFSFNLDAPLKMEFESSKVYKVESSKTYQIINKWEINKLEEIIRNYGEERYAGRIAAAIVKNRPVNSTQKLAQIIAKAVPPHYARSRINPATRTFQALRIATNNELENLESAVRQSAKSLVAGGRLVVVSYHSLEDRIVKRFMREQKNLGLMEILTKKVVLATKEEVASNPRARSAKLRAARKI